MDGGTYLVPGYYAPVHRSLSEPILLGGAPRAVAILNGTLAGALGLGEVGREVAGRAKAMGMHILYHQRRQLPPEVEAQWNAEYVSFDDLFARADFVSIHVPLNDATRGMVDAAAFARMKDGAILINASRAHIVDRDALIGALNSGRLGGAGLDTFSEEPADPTLPVYQLPNVYATPHVAGVTDGSTRKRAVFAADNLDCFARGEPVRGRVEGR
mgnify:CR=1 FL=1